MIPIDRFERRLDDGLADLAAERTPDYLTDLLAQTARRRQRPAWTFPERWLPMTITLRRPMLAPPLRLLAIGIALLLALLAGAMLPAFLARPALPAMVAGLPHDGLIAFLSDPMHIRTIDPDAGTSHPFLRADTIDRPAWSPDGRRLAYTIPDPVGDSRLAVFVGGQEGSLTPTDVPFHDLRVLRWSPDGSTLLVVSSVTSDGSDGRCPAAGTCMGITLVPADPAASAGPETLTLGMRTDWATWQPDGGAILFKGIPEDGTPRLYTLSPGPGSQPQAILDVDTSTPLFAQWGDSEFLWDPTYSPDGSTILYSTVVDPLPGMAPGQQNARARLADADGSNDRVFETSPDSNYEMAWGFAPDGARIALRVERDGGVFLAIAPVDDATKATLVGPSPAIGKGAIWSPDGARLLTWGEDGSAAFVDAATGAMTPIETKVYGDVASWQPVLPRQEPSSR